MFHMVGKGLRPITVSMVSLALVIAEKPSVARDIMGALEGAGERFTKTQWGFEGTRHLVTSARGHLVAEANPERYNEAFKAWRLEDLPIIPEKVLYQPRDKDSSQLLRTLKSLIDRDDVTSLVNACDAGREGELIFKLITQFSGTSKPIERAWFSSMTSQAILQAMNNLRPDSQMKPLEAAARCRSEADWLVGINATRAATVHLGVRELLSLGRVQTPTLALVVGRDLTIENFKPEEYFLLSNDFKPQGDPAALTFTSWLVEPTKAPQGGQTQTWRQARFDNRAAVDIIHTRVQGKPGQVFEFHDKEEQSRAPRLFDLTTLQQEANRRYGFSASRTLVAAQACYETYKVLTYPRTDSSYITSDMEKNMAGVVNRVAVADPALASFASKVNAISPHPASILVNDKKVTDHHAIIPTDAAHDLSKLDADSRRIYDLVARRFLAAQLPPARFSRRTILIQIPYQTPEGNRRDVFRAMGRTPLDESWQLVYPGPGIGGIAKDDAETPEPAKGATSGSPKEDEDESSGPLPELKARDMLDGKNATVVSRWTKPPARFNDASLLGMMSSAGHLVDDEELAEAMKESGLGTPATRASIIERLIKVSYLERKGKAILSTVKGRAVIEVLAGHVLTSPELTGSWEKRLRDIEHATPGSEGALRSNFLNDVKGFTTTTVDEIKSLEKEGFSTADILGPCPVAGCGGQVSDRGKGWVCSSYKSKEERGCGFVIWKTSGGKKLTRAQCATILAKAPSTPPPPPTQRVELAPCPNGDCGGTILVRAKSYSCDSWKNPKETGCGFVIWKSRKDGTEVSEDEARAMVERGEWDKPAVVEVICPCPVPKCKGSIVERAKVFSCTSWTPTKKGCGLAVWKTNKQGQVVATRENLEVALSEALVEMERRKASRKKA